MMTESNAGHASFVRNSIHISSVPRLKVCSRWYGIMCEIHCCRESNRRCGSVGSDSNELGGKARTEDADSRDTIGHTNSTEE